MLLLFSCNSSTKFEKTVTFENGIWDRFKPLEFTVPIKSTGQHDIIIVISHTSEFQYDRLPFHMTITSPSGEMREKEYELILRNNEGKFLSVEKSGGEFSYEEVIRKDFPFGEKGTYIIKIENLIPKVETSEIRSFSLIIK